MSGHTIDLIFFTTTVFTAIAHGPHWHRRYGVPFVVDLQDPWRNDYYLSLPKQDRPRKFWFDHWQKTKLEAATMPHAAGLLSVSDAYVETMQDRYPALRNRPALTQPFGAAASDFDVAATLPAPAKAVPGTVTLRYIGRGGRDMKTALTILFHAVRKGLETEPDLFYSLRLSFQGTSYAATGRGEKTVEPIAEACGVADLVQEETDRLPYFETLRSLMAADILLVPGSDDAGYTASKLYPYILARRPLVALFHEQSSAVEVLIRTKAAAPITFDETGVTDDAISRACDQLRAHLTGTRPAPQTDWAAFEPYTASATTARIAALFNRSLAT
ncbi:hypothetical protein C1J05_05990 [Sulfitobacter sp. JL08]|nr:hypothetical protein C1J05_05990 [Sulfitobacter sp. JL08]